MTRTTLLVCRPYSLLASLVALPLFALACAPQPTPNAPAPTPSAPTAAPPPAPVAAERAAAATPASCAFDSSWLTASSLPTAVVGDDNCAFHRFMWQSFARLIQPADPDAGDAGTVFETFMPEYGIFVRGPKQTPTPWGKPPKLPCKNAAALAADAPLPVFSSITKQAGADQPLIDESGKAVYYGIAVNRVAYDWLTACDLYRYGCAAQLAGGKGGVDLIGKYPGLAFPEQSVELKTAWKVLTEDEDRSGTFYSVEGLIQPIGSPVGTCERATLGLVGLHVVSKVPGHPEFVWATFEHRNNAPDCRDLKAQAPLPGGWTFFDGARYAACKAPRCTNVFEPGQPGQVCRAHPYGDSSLGVYPEGKDCQVDPNQRICQPDVAAQLADNTQAMKAINASAAAAIAGSKEVDRVFANYELVGNLWTVGGALPPISQAWAGSLSAANTTMETYVQDGQAGVQNPANCFTCHNMVSADGTTDLPPAGLSHIFHSVQPKSGGCGTGKLPSTCPK